MLTARLALLETAGMDETLASKVCSEVYPHAFDETVRPLFRPERRHSLLDVCVGISGVDGIAVEEEKTW